VTSPSAQPPADQPRADLDNDLARSSLALIKAIAAGDAQAIIALAGAHADSLPLLITLGRLIAEALRAPSSDNVIAFVDRLFARADRSRS
jgi:hypothetical protein